jgi:alanine dehydrogenase
MRIGVPKEIKVHEYRVGMTPASVREAVAHGHEVLVERDAALRQGITDADYTRAGAKIVAMPEEVFAAADLIVKVKEPQASELKLLRAGQTLFTYLHLAADPAQAKSLMQSGVTAIAYETVTGPRGGLPLLAPMSEVAGRMAVQAGAHCLEMEQGGRGMLLGGVAGVAPVKVAVLGGGVAGVNAVRMAIGLEAMVTVIDINLHRLYAIDQQFGAAVNTIFSTRQAVEDYVLDADLVIGAVLVPGAAAPKLVTRAHVEAMKPGSVIVDISIDQGGCAETSRPTTHAAPTYVEQGVVHYCVTNMPGAVARTSTFALNNATLPFILALANKGPEAALSDDPHLLAGLNVYRGRIAHPAVAAALGESYWHPQGLVPARPSQSGNAPTGRDKPKAARNKK